MEISLCPAAASKVNCDEKAAASQTQGFFEEIVQQLQQLDTQPSASEEKSSDETAVDQNLLQAVGLIAIQLSEAEDKEMEPAVLYEHLTEMINRIPSSPDLEQPLLKLQHVLTDMQRAPASSETDSQEQYLSSISTLLTICKNTSSAFQTEFAQLMEELQKPQLQSVKLSDSQLQGLQKTAAEKIEKIHKQPRVLTDTLHEKRSADFFAVVQAAPKSSVRDMTAFHKEEKVPLLNQLPWKKDVVLRNESMDRDSSKKDSEISFTANTAGARLENTPSSFKSKEVPKGQEFSIDLGQVKSDHQQSTDLVNGLQKIWSKASISIEERASKLSIKLLPKQLGTISIEVLQQDHKTTAQVIVSSAKTKELLDANLFRLRQALTSQHVSVDQVGVDAVHTASESSVRNTNAFRKKEKVPFFNQLPWKKDVVLHSESIDTNSSLKNSESSAGTNTTGATVENQSSSFGTGEMPKLQQFSIYLGQAKSDYQQSSNLVNELEKIWSKASFSTEEGTSKLFIKLFPKQLGAISIEMLQKDSETVARIVVSSAKTKELLDSNLSTLRHGLASQHVSIDKIDVLLSEQAMSYNNENDQQKERQEKEAFKKEEEDQDSQQLEESASFLSSFEAALINYNV
ncbi:flagellar hook-length control protein FliK [Priestia megaterium]|uniref:flagellar hook-length control protein FliK n=1 Tax=Priestia megaterium TaxID=1404 RepID=UPI00244D3A82|nr:flagellar hook-length control protein FliK [Priestia megaterium]MDH2450835.1 flagellar hook-length control protein FliK [Priestia megaterium]MDL5150293.1 flagellar hook-length control protein FliK [Priestia megaterium]